MRGLHPYDDDRNRSSSDFNGFRSPRSPHINPEHYEDVAPNGGPHGEYAYQDALWQEHRILLDRIRQNVANHQPQELAPSENTLVYTTTTPVAPEPPAAPEPPHVPNEQCKELLHNYKSQNWDTERMARVLNATFEGEFSHHFANGVQLFHKTTEDAHAGGHSSDQVLADCFSELDRTRWTVAKIERIRESSKQMLNTLYLRTRPVDTPTPTPEPTPRQVDTSSPRSRTPMPTPYVEPAPPTGWNNSRRLAAQAFVCLVIIGVAALLFYALSLGVSK